MLMTGRYPRFRVVGRLAVIAILVGGVPGRADHSVSRGPDKPVVIPAEVEVIATGIPGAGAICQVGTFHLGGPFPGKPAVQPGAILAPERLLIASSSNFGAPLARADQAPGSILSIDPRGEPVAVPTDWADPGPGGDPQVSILGGRVILYTANSPLFLNSFYNPTAATANEPAVSGPLGISLNNAFGRPWFANAPFGSAGDGTITVIDPDGRPFRGPPNPVAGGVFMGDVTNRSPSSTHGLVAGALATSLITKSPDGSGRAVFFAALADGSIVQVHVQKGVDGLAPPGTVTPIPGVSLETAESTDPDDVVRVGMIFNWVPAPVAPKPVVYITDPLADRIVALELGDDGTLFTQTTRYITSPWLNRPVDIAGTSIETAARNFASNTVIGGGSDLYVLNRGDNTILRMKQNGRIIARRSLDGDVPGMRVAGLAVSDDGRKIWVTATTPDGDGVVLQMDAFGTGDVTASLFQSAASAGLDGAAAQGAHVFSHELAVEEALGPLFNGRACGSCHNSPTVGMGATPGSFVLRVGRVKKGDFKAVRGGPVARQHSIAELGEACGLPTGVPPRANVVSPRSAMTLRGTSLIDTIRDERILAVMEAQPENVRGRPNYMPDGRIGRFGWKAHSPTLVDFMAEAQRDELGLTNPLAPRDSVNGCGANRTSPEVDAVPLTSLVAFLNTIDPPTPPPEVLNSPGAALFASIGCATCHAPSMPGPGSPAAAELPVRLYLDLLLHDMGPELDDGIVQEQATGSQFRTMPLWRVSERSHFLHDGRATTITEAIEAHGGQAAAAAAAFEALSDAEKAALFEFLDGI